MIPRRAVESLLLAGQQAKVLHPDVVNYVLKSFDRRRDEAERHRRRETEIEPKIVNLTRALADGYSPAVRADLARLGAEAVTIRAEIAKYVREIKLVPGEGSGPNARRFVSNGWLRLDWRGLTRLYVGRIRETFVPLVRRPTVALRELVG